LVNKGIHPVAPEYLLIGQWWIYLLECKLGVKFKASKATAGLSKAQASG
jgi:hypothetical protein